MSTITTENRELAIRMWFAADEKCNLDAIGTVEDICWIDAADVVQTADVYADFVQAHGEPQIARTFGDRQAFVWKSVQFRKGQTRGNLYLTEFDGVSASYFAGGQ